MSFKRLLPMTLAVLGLVTTGRALADETIPEIERDAGELENLISDPIEPPGVETALVFSNPGDGPRVVVCRARNAQGRPVGAAAVRVPGNGVRHLLASDLSGGMAFAGQVRCVSPRPLAASGFAASGPRLTDVPVHVDRRPDAIHYGFPIVATR